MAAHCECPSDAEYHDEDCPLVRFIERECQPPSKLWDEWLRPAFWLAAMWVGACVVLWWLGGVS